MATIDSSGKLAYMYDQGTDTWYAISAAVNTAGAYTWTATNTYTRPVIFNDVIKALGGVNNFATTANRDTAIPSPVHGLTCFIKETNQIQFFDGLYWRNYGDATLLGAESAAFELALTHAGKTVNLSIPTGTDGTILVPPNSSVPFPLGTRIDFIASGDVLPVFNHAVGVTLNSKNNNRKIAAKHSGATLVKLSLNTWTLIGDLTAE